MKPQQFDFSHLVQQIKDIHNSLQMQATKVVNIALTMWNWIIGGYIYEYEQGGEDPVEYGGKLLAKLCDSLQNHGLKRIEEHA